MRTIKFRGKRIDNGEWTYGDLLRLGGNKRTFIFTDDDSIDNYSQEIRSKREVIPETVGQFTGLLEMNGREIYEGDIVRNGFNRIMVCEWFKGGFWLNGGQNGANYNIHLVYKTFEVIGNIHDNPELLTVNKQI